MNHLKPKLLLRVNKVKRTAVVFGSSPICETDEAHRRVGGLRAGLSTRSSGDQAYRVLTARRRAR
jgi:hypothetical protein